ncbi:hypothetical protein ACEWY4_019351 [Coilia grayii]|uniref:TTF-type domain-containing protein n=1 Tax=Coilia grayii TaxID=363190 RepID=A0ABD1J9G7_9TELE
MSNGEKVQRDWLLYSKNTNRVHCSARKLFGGDRVAGTRLVVGYNNWQRLSRTLQHHETSSFHINAYLLWKELASRLRIGKTIDSTLQRSIDAEKAHWRSVLKQVMDCILFLAERNLPLRGKNAKLGDPKNGNFLGVLEVIARCDVTLAEHLRRAASKETTGHLSWCTQNEFLDSISECILHQICAQVKAAKYFAVELDCTSDISKQEQASVIIRYVHTDDNKKARINESFVGFTVVKDTTGKGLTETLLGLYNLGLCLANCRGQSYDHGSNMRGVHKGVQALVQQNHSLNLLLCHAAASNKACLTFFSTLQRLYTIFSASVKRWDILKEFVDISLKPLTDTRCEAKIDSVKAVRFQLGGILDALEKLEEVEKDGKIVSEAASLSGEIVTMEFLMCLLIWYDLLSEITFVSKAMQAVNISMDTAIRMIDSLKEFFLKYREEGFQNAIDVARKIAIEMDATPEFRERRVRKQKRFHGADSSTGHFEQDPETHFRCMVFNVIVDTVIQELSDRFCNLQLVSEKFKFIFKMHHMTKAELEESVTRYALATNDVSRDIILEIYPASRLLRGHEKALDKLNFLLQENLDLVFPNLTVALRVFLTKPMTVASAERSFSKLKLIKTYLRSNMSNDRLTQLAVISIENSVARTISFDTIIDGQVQRHVVLQFSKCVPEYLVAALLHKVHSCEERVLLCFL